MEKHFHTRITLWSSLKRIQIEKINKLFDVCRPLFVFNSGLQEKRWYFLLICHRGHIERFNPLKRSLTQRNPVEKNPLYGVVSDILEKSQQKLSTVTLKTIRLEQKGFILTSLLWNHLYQQPNGIG